MADYSIEFTLDAIRQIGELHVHKRRTVLDSIDEQLQHQPNTETRRRKKLRPNIVAGWQLSIADIRVLYDVLEDEKLVSVIVIGRKQGNRLFVDGEEIKL